MPLALWLAILLLPGRAAVGAGTRLANALTLYESTAAPFGTAGEPVTISIDEEVADQLRSIGYGSTGNPLTPATDSTSTRFPAQPKLK